MGNQTQYDFGGMSEREANDNSETHAFAFYWISSAQAKWLLWVVSWVTG